MAKPPTRRDTPRQKPKLVEVRPEDVRPGQRGPERTDSLNRVVGAFLVLATIVTVCGLLILAAFALLSAWLQPGS